MIAHHTLIMLLSAVLFVIVIGSSVTGVRIYEQCGGEGYRGPAQCGAGLRCLSRSKWFSSCQSTCPSGWECHEQGEPALSGMGWLSLPWEQCGGQGYRGATACPIGFTCYARSAWYSQCRPDCPRDWICRQQTIVEDSEEKETPTLSPITDLIDEIAGESEETSPVGEEQKPDEEGGSGVDLDDLIDELIDPVTPDNNDDKELTDEYGLYDEYELDEEEVEPVDCQQAKMLGLRKLPAGCEEPVEQAPDCTASGNRAGFCLPTMTCKSRGGTSVPGFCLGQPKDIQCCVDGKNEQTSTVDGGCEDCGASVMFSTSRYVGKTKTQYGPANKGIKTLSNFTEWDSVDNLQDGDKEIFIAMAKNEGKLDSVHSWDNQIATVGAMQKTINGKGTGEFPKQVWEFKQANPVLYEKLFETCGWTVEKTGKSDPVMKFNGNTGPELKALITEGFNKEARDKNIKQKSAALGPLVCASRNDVFQLKQVEDKVTRLHDVVLPLKPKGHKFSIGDYLKSNLGKATVLDHHVNRPAYAARDFGKALDRFFARNTDVSKDPSNWGAKHAEYERAILDDYGVKREMAMANGKSVAPARYAQLKKDLE